MIRDRDISRSGTDLSYVEAMLGVHRLGYSNSETCLINVTIPGAQPVVMVYDPKNTCAYWRPSNRTSAITRFDLDLRSIKMFDKDNISLPEGSFYTEPIVRFDSIGQERADFTFAEGMLTRHNL
jgi:hypothetical protein